MGRIRLSLIGCGGIAGAHAGAISGLGGLVDLTAVVDPVAAARSSFAEKTGASAFGSLEELLAARAAGRVEVDAVVLCVPPSGRLPLVESALGAGLAVLAEKPLASSHAEAAALVALAERYPSLLTAVAYCHRFTPALVEMKRQLHAGKVGRPVRFENHFACWHPTLEQKWMSDPAVSGGGSVVDTGCHSLDLLGFLVDGMDRVRVRGLSVVHAWDGRGDTNATMLVEAKHGGGEAAQTFGGVISSGWAEPDRFTVSVTGTLGTLSYDFLASPEVLSFAPSHAEVGGAEAITVGNHEVRFADQLEAFASAVRDGGSAGMQGSHGLASFGEAAVVAKLVEDAYGSVASERAVADAVAVDPVVVAKTPRKKVRVGPKARA